MSERNIRQWCHGFKNGRINVHNDERSGKPGMQSDEIASLVDQKEKIQDFLGTFLTTHRTVPILHLVNTSFSYISTDYFTDKNVFSVRTQFVPSVFVRYKFESNVSAALYTIGTAKCPNNLQPACALA
jgi:hypothetical protein